MATDRRKMRRIVSMCEGFSRQILCMDTVKKVGDCGLISFPYKPFAACLDFWP